ncbi:MAG: hypothetical protein ACOCVC_09345 [Spirochaeta sp.]
MLNSSFEGNPQQACSGCVALFLVITYQMGLSAFLALLELMMLEEALQVHHLMRCECAGTVTNRALVPQVLLYRLPDEFRAIRYGTQLFSEGGIYFEGDNLFLTGIHA